MIIRKAKIKDIKQCLNIQKLDNGKYWKAIDFKKSVQNKGVVFLVAEENKEILGYITGFIVPTKRTDALLHETRVDKRQRKKGIGKKLVNAFCKEIFKKDSKIIYALIEPEHIKFYVNTCKFKKTQNWIEIAKKKV